MVVKEIHLDDYRSLIEDAVKQNEDVCLYAILPKVIVYKGEGDIDEDYCKANNIEVYASLDPGGGIVGFEGDVVIVTIEKDGWGKANEYMDYLCDYLKEKGLNVKKVGNDLLVDNDYKVASSASINLDPTTNRIYNALQITFNANREFISHICKKPMVKIPRGLSYYNLSNTDVLQKMLSFIGG